MSKVVNLPDNFIGKVDAAKLESFGGHTLSLGRATRWHWDKDDQGNDVFEIYRGGADEVLAACIKRDRDRDSFLADDRLGNRLATGKLEQLLAQLETYFSLLHGEGPNSPA